MASVPKILYVDDEADILNLAESFFEDEQLPLDTCSTFHEALEKIKTTRYDLIISDAHMPTGNGSDLFKLIRAEKIFDGKFILVTGNIDHAPDAKAAATYDRVIFKPLSFQDLIEEVKQLLSVKL